MMGPGHHGRDRELSGNVKRRSLVVGVAKQQFWWRREISKEDLLCFGMICDTSPLFKDPYKILSKIYTAPLIFGEVGHLWEGRSPEICFLVYVGHQRLDRGKK